MNSRRFRQALPKRKKREDDAGLALEPDEIVTIKNTMGSKRGKISSSP